MFQCRCILRDQGGTVSVIAALSIMMLLAVAAIVIDTGSLYLARRALQATNDAAALAAVQDPDNASAVAADIFAQNGYAGESLTVTTGIYTADESLDADDRFVPAGLGANAVEVVATLQQHNYLAPLFGLSNLTALKTRAVAARVPTASFGAGSRLAELNGGYLNTVLGATLGSSLSLSLVDYQNLVATNISALSFFNQLATDLDVTGSYDELATADVTVGQLVTAMAEVAATPGAASGNVAGAQQALQTLGLQVQPGSPVTLSDLVDLSSLYGRNIGNIASVDGQDQQINLMGLLSGAASSSASGKTISIGNIPVAGSSVAMRLATGDRMAQIGSARLGSSIHSAPIRVAMVATLANVNLVVTTATIQVPIYLEADAGTATLTGMPCTVGGTLVNIDASAGATKVQFGTVSDAALRDFSTPVTPAAGPILNISLLGIPIQVNISGTVSVTGTTPQPLAFTQANIDAGTVKSVSGGLSAPFTGLSSNITLTTNILGSPGLLAGLLNSQLNTLTAALQPVVANLVSNLDSPSNSLLTTLGLQLGITDVRVFDARCRTPTLEG